MAPAFHSNGRAAGLGALLLFLMLLPVTLHLVGNVPLAEAYRGISERAGPFDRIRRQVFEDHSDLDVMICGSSLLRGAIQTEMLQRELSEALGRQASVALVPQSWQGPDMNYFVSRDLMEHRKVKLFVIATPAHTHRSSQPHVQLFRVIRYGDHPGALDGLPLRYRLNIYADYVLGAPRQALNLFRPNYVDPNAGLDADEPTRVGYMNGPFVPHRIVPNQIAPESVIYSPATRDSYRFDGEALNGYQFHFLRKTVELAREHGALLVILHLPSPSERGSDVVPERQPMPDLFGAGVVYLGIPSNRLFAKVPSEEVLDYFKDEHLNWNGMQLYTETLAPILARIYEQSIQAH